MAGSEQVRRAAEKRADAMAGRHDERWISALEIERQGYVVRGMNDRAAQVDEQLAIARGETLRRPRRG